MAHIAKRLPQNIAGRYYVDDECIDCGLCPEIAPEIFGADPEVGINFVVSQPQTPDGEQLCREAMNICPVDAIGDDGHILPAGKNQP